MRLNRRKFLAALAGAPLASAVPVNPQNLRKPELLDEINKVTAEHLNENIVVEIFGAQSRFAEDKFYLGTPLSEYILQNNGKVFRTRC